MLSKTISSVALVQSGGTRDNFNKFSGDDGLAGPVEGQGQLVNHLSGVLGSVVHGRHAGGLLGAGAFLQGVEQHGGERELHVRLDHVGVQRVVGRQFGGALEVEIELISILVVF